MTKFNISRTTSAPPSTPPVPAAPSLVSPPNGDNPTQPITFQWSIASGTASYTIQIDDSSAFSAPLVREQQNITDVRYATGGLATTQHFWRVRGVNTAGVAGATYIFCLPGSPGACRDGWDGILAAQLDYRTKPCNFVEIMPRLDEHLRRDKAKGATV